MAAVEELITEHMDVWTSAVKRKSSAGRGGGKKIQLYGVKKLRELILDLAVRGLLVPQDAGDEPASVLLERIAAEKAGLVGEKKIPKQKKIPSIEPELLSALPIGWKYARFGDLTKKLGSGSTPKGGQRSYVESGVPFLRSQNIWNNGLELSDVAFITVETHKVMSNTQVLQGDVLLNITGASLGRSTIYQCEFPEANVNQHVTIIRLVEGEMRSFVHLGILSPMIQQLVWGRQVGMAIEGLSKKVLELFEFPIPPLAEQHRIVAKVDELMAICDQLEQQSEASLAAHQTLVQTLLNALTQSASSAPASRADDQNNSDPTATQSPFEQAWHRIAAHFDTLFTTEHSIEQLKQIILQLAVMGKLVPQDPSDEPASELLKRIAAEKAELVKAKKIKKQKALPEIAENEMFFSIPKSWDWCRLDNICYGVTSGSTPPKSDFTENAGIPFLKVYNIRNQGIDFPYKPQFLTEVYHQTKSKRSILYPGDVVMNIVGPPLGKTAVIPEQYPEWNCNQAITFFRPIIKEFNHYIYTYIKAGVFLDSIELIGTAGQDNISVTKSRSIALPTPPLNEQKRIVAKVDELMALCDQLKARLTDAQNTQLQLADAVTEQAIS